MRNIVHLYKFVEFFRCINRKLIIIKNHLAVRMLLFISIKSSGPLIYVMRSPRLEERMTDDFIVPKVHIKRQLIVNTLHMQSRVHGGTDGSGDE